MDTGNEATGKCRGCGKELSAATAAQGLCPECVLKAPVRPGPIPEEAPTVLCAEPTARPFGEYDLLEEIGRGGMGVVYKARQRSLERIVAIKMLAPGVQANPEYVKRLRAEATAAACLQHPHIVAIHEVGVHEGQHYFAMDYVPGPSLAHLAGGRPLPAQQVARYAQQIAEALHYAHEHGILHRDIKPSNVLIDSEDQPHITDFGLAKRLQGDSELTVTGQILGSPPYMPPEQVQGKRAKLSRATDIYGMGAMLYHLLTGRPPFVAQEIAQIIQLVLNTEPLPPRQLNGSVPRDLETICLKCLEKDPSRRFATARDLADELSRFLNHEPIRTRPIGPAGRVWRWCQRKPALAAAVGLAAVFFVTGATGVLWQWRKTERAYQEQRVQSYASDMSAAQVALERNNVGMAVHLLSRYFPNKGQEDLRGIEWRLLWSQSRSQDEGVFTDEAMVTSADISPGARWLAAASPHDGKIHVYDRSSRKQLLELPCEPSDRPDQRVAFSADGQWFAAQTTNGVEIWRLPAWTKERTLSGTNSTLGFSGSGTVFANWDGTGLRAWRASDWTALGDFQPEIRYFWYEALALDQDGSTVFISDRNSNVRAYETRTGRRLKSFAMNEPVALAVSPNNRWLAAASFRGNAAVWDLETSQLAASLKPDAGLCFGLTFSPDSRWLLTGGSDQHIRFWEAGTTNLLATLRGHRSEIWRLRCSGDGQHIVSCGKDMTTRIWPLRFPTNEVYEFKVTPYAPELIGVGDQQVHFLDRSAFAVQHRILPSFELEKVLPLARKGTGNPTTWKTNAKYVGAGYDDGWVRIWDINTGAMLYESRPSTNASRLAALSPGGEIVVLGGGIVWNARTGVNEFTDPQLRSAALIPAQFSPDGKWLAYAADPYECRIWDLRAKRLAAVLKGHIWHLYALSFSPDSKLLATTSWDGQVLLWDMRTFKLNPPPLTGHRAGVWGALFSPDGKTLVSEDGTSILFWSVATHLPMLQLKPTSATIALFPNGMLTQLDAQELQFLSIPGLQDIDRERK
jgi:eukaryotic-like serine/threonine-protein kinase